MQLPMYLGIEIGGTKLQLAIGRADGTIVQTWRYTIDAAAGAGSIRQQLQQAIEQVMSAYAIEAVGVGFGGPVDWRTGTIQVSHQVTGWQHFDLKSWLQDITGKPVIIDNDANVAALAEATQGGGKNHPIVFYMTIGSGIGGGLIINQKIYHGHAPGEVEIGHIRLDKSGNTLESKCSGWAVNGKVREYINTHPQSLLATLAKTKNTPEAMLLQPALERSDKAAQQIVHEVADDMAFALSHVVHLFHPDVIIIGGGLSLLQDSLVLPIAEQLPRHVMKAFLPPPPVRTAALGEEVVPIGALELAKTIGSL